MTPQDIQLSYELDSDAAAAAARLQDLQQAAVSGDADLPRAQRLVGQMHATVAGLLEEAIAVKTRGTGGVYKGWLRRVGADKAALIALRECITLCSPGKRGKPATAQSLCKAMGRLYETEVRITEAEEVNPMYMERIHEQVKANATRNVGHLRRLYNVAYDRVMKGELDSEISDSEAIQIGKFGLSACYDAGLVSIERYEAGMAIYKLDDEIADYLNSYTESDVHTVVDRGAGAMTCEPLPWTGLSGGGYLSVRRQQQFPLMDLRRVRRSERKRLRALFTPENMPEVFACANALQSVAFMIHKPTLDAVQRCWGTGGNVMGMPSREKPKKPEMPLGPEWVKADATDAEMEVFTAWKREASKYYGRMKEWRGHASEIMGFLKLGHRQTESIWFPTMVDTRGRWYYNGTPNPQGTDMAKAALHFAVKKPLGATGVFWLKVHIANCFGFDKQRREAKAAWTDSHWEAIERALDDPENHPEVWGGKRTEDGSWAFSDAPWCMYSAAWELREAYRSGNPAKYECGVPVHMDASCSGLQHFSAMLRDPLGGRYVNLFDAGGAAKQDIYTKVAEGSLATMRGDHESAARTFWLDHGIGRSEAKTPVMTYVYGATLRGTSEFLEDTALSGREDSKVKGERNVDFSLYGAKSLFAGIAKTVPAADQAMRWLREVCRTVPKGSRMEWTSPTGFLVQHDYQAEEQTRIRINSCGVNRVLIHVKLDETNPHRMQNAIAPNFVHALDASHLTKTANTMFKRGLQMVGIHDSFGTHPCDVAEMHIIIRDEFIKMYQNKNVLEDFLWEVGGTGEVPKYGSLNLEDIRSSEFFFT